MKRVILAVILLFVVGCGPFNPALEQTNDTARAGDAVNVTDTANTANTVNITPTANTADNSLPATSSVNSSEPRGLTEEELSVTNTSAIEESELNISGKLELQKTLELCPHLQRSFECDKYDLRSCNFKKIVGAEGFYPDYIICEPDGNYKKCFIQECAAHTKGGIVQNYGGTIAYARYRYSESKTAKGGIMTKYKLESCGEIKKSFVEKFDCTTYYSEWRKLWN